ncbi:metallophosphoesterase [Aneurinibacillus terranovensis]|uniref:metallophosphoesterase n=1 Tax=Aneurinibacillus terranovensis TaxID=278991 RepID=UPI0003F76C92|nr:metallophosphoesterase [Aneurinibacillus terranovensis]
MQNQIELGNGLDFIGDIHACFDELIELLHKLGYIPDRRGLYKHPEGRRIVSLGDVMSRGPYSIQTMVFFKNHMDAGLAYMIDSNHGWKIARWLDGRKVTMGHGDEKVEEEFAAFVTKNGRQAAEKLKKELRDLLMGVPSHLIIVQDGIQVAVAAHAGIRDNYIGKDSKRIRDFCRYGDTDGFDETGRPIRKDWTVYHRSDKIIIWGHDPKPEPLVKNNTVNIDQGAVFGGYLSAYRFPEKEFVSVKAKENYSGLAETPLNS